MILHIFEGKLDSGAAVIANGGTGGTGHGGGGNGADGESGVIFLLGEKRVLGVVEHLNGTDYPIL